MKGQVNGPFIFLVNFDHIVMITQPFRAQLPVPASRIRQSDQDIPMGYIKRQAGVSIRPALRSLKIQLEVFFFIEVGFQAGFMNQPGN